MNRKQLIILLVLVAIVGGAGLLIYNKQNEERKSGNLALGRKLAADLPVNDVARIDIRRGASELNLVKKDDLWRVRERNNYPANFSQIREFLNKLRDLKIVQSQTVGPSQMPRLGFASGSASNAAIVVDFKDQNDKTLKSLLLGKEHTRKSSRPSNMGEMGGEDGGWPDGRYVKVGADSDNVDLISDALSNIEPKPEAWLDKDFFKVEKVRSIAVAFPAATNSWKLTRDTESGEWKLADAKPGEQLDSAKTSALSNPLNSPSFDDVKPDVKPEDLSPDKATAVTLGTFDNFTYTLKVGPKTNDSNYLLAMSVVAELPKERAPGKDEKAEDKARLDKEFKDNQQKLLDKLAQEKPYEKWVYLVSSWTVDPILKERNQLLAEKKDEKKEEKGAAAAPKKEDSAAQAADAKAGAE